MLAITLLIFKRKTYLIPASIVAAIIFTASYALTVWNISSKSIVAYASMSGWSFTLSSLFLSLVISVLAGIYFSLFLVRRQLIKDKELSARGGSPPRADAPQEHVLGGKNKLSSTGGTAIGLLAAGCPTCGAPLFALFGAPLALFSLPFHGLELKVLSIVLLLLSVYLIVENIQKQLTTCHPEPADV